MDWTVVVVFFAGLGLLVLGAEALVRGASRLAAAAGVSSLVIGLTVVAYGTSAPEMAVSVKAAWSAKADLSVGNVVGSNIFNVLFILGVSAAITPLLAAFLGQSPLHEVAFLPNGAAGVREAVRSFLQRRKASAGPTVMRWGAYCFDPLQSTVGLEGAAPVPLSRQKFRFALSLFLHQGVELSWADLHRMAWGHDRPARRASVAAHATWAGETLKLTVYNGTQWRVTELYVKVSRFQDEDFVEDPRPVLLVPPGQSVDASVADLLSRVAPDRKKAGLNPADTGPFEGKAGQQPENFRWEIESARGYAPR